MISISAPLYPGQTGTCQACRATVRVHPWQGERRLRTRLLIADHSTLAQRTTRTAAVPYRGDLSWVACGGSALPSLERIRADQMKDAAKRTNGRLALIEPFRESAAIALDAAIERRVEMTTDIRILCRVAIYEYRARYPKSNAVRLFKVRARKKRDRTRSGRCDLYCLFCGVLLMLDVDDGGQTLARVERNPGPVASHVTTCALKHLAWSLHPKEPDFVKLPEDVTETDEDESETHTTQAQDSAAVS